MSYFVDDDTDMIRPWVQVLIAVVVNVIISAILFSTTLYFKEAHKDKPVVPKVSTKKVIKPKPKPKPTPVLEKPVDMGAIESVRFIESGEYIETQINTKKGSWVIDGAVSYIKGDKVLLYQSDRQLFINGKFYGFY